jgi:S1/P1 Nuclease
MKKTLCLLLVTFVFVAPAGSVFAWGNDGHQTVGKIASLRVKRGTARRIAAILKPGETLSSVSTWADTVKERMGTNDPDPDTNAFLQDMVHNEKNREWHYDDLPLNCGSYQTCAGFTVEHDVVNMINVCIRTLQGRPDPNHPLSERNALRLLVHLVGDMHQPLHVGSGYIDEHGPNGAMIIERDPRVIQRKHLDHDRGGNQLILDNNRKRLHGFWDFDLVSALMLHVHQPTSDELGTFLKQNVRPESAWNPRGRVGTWAAQWATDSLHQSRNQTYRGIRITGKRNMTVTNRDGQPVMRDGRPVTELVYDVTKPANYEALNREIVRVQLAKGGYRLARLLDEIFR